MNKNVQLSTKNKIVGFGFLKSIIGFKVIIGKPIVVSHHYCQVCCLEVFYRDCLYLDVLILS